MKNRAKLCLLKKRYSKVIAIPIINMTYNDASVTMVTSLCMDNFISVISTKFSAISVLCYFNFIPNYESIFDNIALKII